MFTGEHATYVLLSKLCHDLQCCSYYMQLVTALLSPFCLDLSGPSCRPVSMPSTCSVQFVSLQTPPTGDQMSGGRGSKSTALSFKAMGAAMPSGAMGGDDDILPMGSSSMALFKR